MKKKLIILVIVVILFILMYNIIFKKIEDNNKEIEFEDISEEEVLDEFFSNNIIPMNVYILRMNYKGEVSPTKFYDKIYEIVQILPIYRTIDAKLYYSENSNIVKYKLGIEDEETFIKLCSIIKERNIDTTEYEQIKFNENYLEKENEELMMELIIKYSDEKVITLQMLFSNNDLEPVIRICEIK